MHFIHNITQFIGDNLNDNAKEFPLIDLEQKLEAGFHNRTFEEFRADPTFQDFWGIERHHIKKGHWKKAYTFSNSHEGINKGFFHKDATTDAMIPIQRDLVVGGAKCVTWKSLLEKHSKRKYLDTDTTFGDYAKLNENLILNLRDINLKQNTGKVTKASDGRVLYVARVKMDEKDHIVFSTISNLGCYLPHLGWTSNC
jgi:hypothetical protein